MSFSSTGRSKLTLTLFLDTPLLPFLQEYLEDADISWQVYQNTDNFGELDPFVRPSLSRF